MHLGGLSSDETRSYIQHHLEVAGVGREIFTAEAAKLIYEHSRGIPRKINNICNSCLLLAFSREDSLIDDGLVRQVITAEFALPG